MHRILLGDQTARREGNFNTPSEYGTRVHKNLENQIKILDDPNFIAERSYVKADRAARRGQKGSIRIDVLENVGNGTVCVYDIKTGDRGLSILRSREIVGRVATNFPFAKTILMIETRPTR